MSGVLRSINTSNGGVPKLPRVAAEQHLRYHGGPGRAVSLYSLELIHALQAEGHPLEPGTLGENLTLAGIGWAQMLPGAALEVGATLLELTAYAGPCTNLLPYFRDGQSKRVSQKVHPGWSRLYARVLREGSVKLGDPVRLQ